MGTMTLSNIMMRPIPQIALINNDASLEVSADRRCYYSRSL